MNNFYVYVLLDPRKPGIFRYGDYTFNHEPFYIGKGKCNRCREHLGQLRHKSEKTHKANKIRKIFNESGLEPIIQKIYENLSEDVSLEIEKQLISLIGRHDLNKGPLTNLTDGGDGVTGFSGGRIVSEEHKKKLKIIFQKPDVLSKCRESHLGEKNAMYGKKHTVEARKKMSDSRKGKSPWSAGKSMSEEFKEKIRKSKLGKSLSEETKSKLSEYCGEKSYWFGKKRSEETCKKMRERKISDETRRKMSESRLKYLKKIKDEKFLEASI